MTFRLMGLSLLGAGLAIGELEMPSFFSDGMVLQRDGAAKIWGWESEGTQVTVSFAGKSETAKANADGRWEVTLNDLKATGKGQDLTVAAGKDQKVIKDVLVGEVWIASGQSNMEWKLSRTEGAKEAIESSKDPFLRVYLTPNLSKAEPQIDFPGKWTEASSKSAGEMTAVGFYFAQRLREELEVPVGIIECAWGGKPIESFISEEALKALPEGEVVLKKKAQAMARWNPEKEKERFAKILAKWENNKRGGRPQLQLAPDSRSNFASNIYQGMIAPLAGYGSKGVIWYQGESNASGGTGPIYEELLGCLVDDWRTRWGSDLSFYYAQLANFEKKSAGAAYEEGWVTVQDEMRRALDSIEGSGMAVLNDIGDPTNIHPQNKVDVGDRLARWALAKDYGDEAIVISGPLFVDAERKGDRMIVSFEHNEGLKSRDGGPLQRFELKGKGGDWQAAEAKIESGKVVVWSESIKRPEEVRYAWAINPTGANLVNGEGLPTSCFTTEEAQ